MKTVGIIGMLVFLGIIIQIILGYIVASNSVYLPVHIAIGILGLALVGYETYYALKSSKNYIKILNIIALILVIVQIGMGSSMIEHESEILTRMHQINAYILFILLTGIGYLTFKGSRKVE